MNIQKIAIVTGAGQGIGLAVCKKLANHNFKLVLNDLDANLAQTAVNEINSNYEKAAIAFPGDCSNLDFIDNLINFTIENFGTIDVLVANAGLTAFGDFFSFSLSDFESVVNLNLRGTFFIVQKVSNYLRETKKTGSIVLMSSVVGHQAHRNLAAYAMSKAGIEMLAKNLVIELSPLKIRINCVAPGATITERTSMEPNYNHIWEQITPLGSLANVNHIADAVYFLASDSAAHITGQTLIVDGGWTSISPQPD